MAEVGSVEFNINVENQKANRAIDESTKKVDTLAKATKNADEQTAKSAKNMGGAWDSLKGKITGALIIGSVVGIGKAMLNTATEFEQARGIIAQGTGATGDALNSLLGNAKNVFAELPQDIAQVADGIQDVNTRFGYTGQVLETAIKQFGKFAKISNQNINQVSSNASKLANKWSLSGKEIYDTLDKITAVAQASGIGIGQLESQLTESSNRLMAMGLSIDESISLLGSLEKYGVNASSAIMAMSMSFAQSGKSGKDAKAEWQKFTEAVKNATTETDANQIAAQKLGTRYAAELLPAIRKGALDFNNYAKAIQDANGITEQTFNDSLTSVEKIQIALKPIENEMGDLALSFVNDLLPAFKGFLDTLKENLPEIKELAKVLLDLARVVVALPAGLAKTSKELTTMNKQAYEFMRGNFNAEEYANQFKKIEANYDAFVAKFKNKWSDKVKFEPFDVIIEKAPEVATKINSILQLYKGTTGKTKQMLSEIEEVFKDYENNIEQVQEKTEEFQTDIKTIDPSPVREQLKNIGDAFKDFPSNVQIADKAVQQFASDVSSYLGQFVGSIKQLANNITSLVVAPFQKEEKIAKENYDKISKQLDKQLADYSDEKNLEKKILQDTYNEGRMSRDEYLLELEDLNQQELANKQKVEKEKAKAEQEYRAKREEAERKAFEANKKNQYAMAVIDFIKGVAEGYSHGILIGSVNAAIMAGIMGTQLALISQQEYTPSFAIGTDRVPETGYALLHKNEAVLNVADANRYRYAESHLAEQTAPVFNIVLTGNVDVDGSKLASIVLQNWNEAYTNKVGR